MTTEPKPAHALLSPSARHRWGNCPASARVALQYAERKAGPAAIDGTHSHTVLEYCLKNSVEPQGMLGQVMIDHEGEFTIDQDRIDRIKVAFDYVVDQVTARGEGLPHVRTECLVNPASLVSRDDMGGTVDVQIHSNGLLELIDYKDGMNPTDAREQLEQYAVGALAEALADPNPAHIFEKVRLTVIQPKLALSGMNPISSIDMDASDVLFKIVPKLIDEASATDDPDAQFIPGEKQCKYCSHRGNCKPAFEHSMGQAGVKFNDLSKPTQSMTDEELRKVIESVPLLRAMIEAVEGEALERFKSGRPITGLKMVRNAGRRTWAMPEEEIAEKLSKMKVPKDLIYRSVLISPAQTDKLNWKNRKGEEVSLTERQRKVLEQDMIKKSEGSLAVVPESDRRSAIDTGDISKMFQNQLPNWMS